MRCGDVCLITARWVACRINGPTLLECTAELSSPNYFFLIFHLYNLSAVNKRFPKARGSILSEVLPTYESKLHNVT